MPASHRLSPAHFFGPWTERMVGRARLTKARCSSSRSEKRHSSAAPQDTRRVDLAEGSQKPPMIARIWGDSKERGFRSRTTRDPSARPPKTSTSSPRVVPILIAVGVKAPPLEWMSTSVDSAIFIMQSRGTHSLTAELVGSESTRSMMCPGFSFSLSAGKIASNNTPRSVRDRSVTGIVSIE